MPSDAQELGPILVRVDTAARLLDASPSTVLYWIRTGKLPAVKVGRSWRIRRGDIEALHPGAGAAS